MPPVSELSPLELKARLGRAGAPLILDVREPEEIAIAPFPHALHIPLGDLAARLSELDPDREIVVVCHHGIRSAQAAIYLARAGFERVSNLAGGIDAWAEEADPSTPRY
jgi:rhodanese-related sulfurtransferase